MVDRLPQHYIPLNYDLYIHFKKKEYPFSARVTITFQKNDDDDKVYLHINPNLIIEKVTQNEKQLKFDIEFPKLTIYRLKEPDQDISSYPITIEYLVLPNFYDKKGLYGYEEYFFTQFEPNWARYLLPCFDEPCIRSTFSVKLQIPSDLKGISNMPISSTKQIDDNEQEITFLPTPAMCTYLLCICVGDFDSIEGQTKSGIPVRFFAKPKEGKKIDDYDRFVRIAAYSVDWMEENLGVKYELPHLQFISHEGFETGMENYGLIALCDCLECGFLQTTTTIMHEVAHLWFGDLVSIEWWDSIWLNEGFAQYFEFSILSGTLGGNSELAEEMFTKYNGFSSLDFFSVDKIWNEKDEIDFEKVDPLRIVMYVKGAFVLKMFRDIVGEKEFMSLCSKWIIENKYKSVGITDFLRLVNETFECDYTDFFTTWMKSVGFPLLNVVEMYYDDDADSDEMAGIIITQSSVSDSVFKFKLPIVYQYEGEVKRMEILIEDVETTVEVKFDWILVNDNLSSLCAVIYSNALMARLVDANNEKGFSEFNAKLIALSPEIIEKDFQVDGEVRSMCRSFVNGDDDSECDVTFPSSYEYSQPPDDE